jgi:hypothetical protein
MIKATDAAVQLWINRYGPPWAARPVSIHEIINQNADCPKRRGKELERATALASMRAWVRSDLRRGDSAAGSLHRLLVVLDPCSRRASIARRWLRRLEGA